MEIYCHGSNTESSSPTNSQTIRSNDPLTKVKSSNRKIYRLTHRRLSNRKLNWHFNQSLFSSRICKKKNFLNLPSFEKFWKFSEVSFLILSHYRRLITALRKDTFALQWNSKFGFMSRTKTEAFVRVLPLPLQNNYF